MKVLVIGNGAREHVIVEKLAENAEVYAVMSKKNPAIAQLSKKHYICDIEDPDAVRNAIKDDEFDIGFSSPDGTLAAGITDVLQDQGMLIASPLKSAARIEWDKGFMRNLMNDHKIDGRPKYKILKTLEEVETTIKEYGQVAIKPLGLTGGKGVKVSGDHFQDLEGALAYADSLIKKDGQVLIEEKLIGEEFTLQAFCDGTRLAAMPPVQDHKRAFVQDKGPNTGGMGSYSNGPNLPFLADSDLEQAKKIMQDVIHAMKKENSPFTGILYGQFMAGSDGVKVVEFNSRFGDPEAMNVLPLLESSLLDVFLSMADGNLETPKFSNDCTVVKYLVPEGYPDNPKRNIAVSVDDAAIEKLGAKVYYASVYEDSGKIYTTGSRSFGILGRGDSLEQSEKMAEAGCNSVSGDVWHREDIGTQALVQKRIKHMQELRKS